MLVPCIKLARQPDNYLEAGMWQWQCIYPVAKAMLVFMTTWENEKNGQPTFANTSCYIWMKAGSSSSGETSEAREVF